MADTSTFMRMNYPEENEDPFWENWLAFVQSLDEHLYMAKVKSNLMLIGGGTVAFDSGTGVLSWTEDFVIPYFELGYKIIVSYGPDDGYRQATLSDGEALVIEVPFAMSADTTVQAQVVSTLTLGSSIQWVLGFRSGTSFYMRGKETI